MCGITGLLRTAGFNEDSARCTLSAMTTCLAHRGPDDSGVWIDAAAGIGLGHRRLSILDLSPLGHQPMQSSCGRYVVVFNGEIYNFRALRFELDGRGYKFRGHSDTEVLLTAVAEWGVRAALERFNGMFAFALWDRQERVLYLARDRAGEKPLYYGWIGRTLVFASELKAIHAHPDFVPEIDRDALTLYLRYNCVPAPYSIYRGIQKLPAGSFMSIDVERGGKGAPESYWSARAVAEAGVADRFPGSADEAIAVLDELLCDATKIRMEADVPLGAFLSGGVDSSLVVALMQAQSARPVKTFTIGFEEGAYNEAEHARLVASHLGTDHTELYVTPQQAMEVIPRLPILYDEPFSDSSQIPTFLVSELARRHVTVSLSGDGGDELFGGYDRYFWGQRFWNTVGRIPGETRRQIGQLVRRLPTAESHARLRGLPFRRVDRLTSFRIGPRLEQLAEFLAIPHVEGLYRHLISHWRDGPASVVLGGEEPTTLLTSPNAWPQLPSLPERMMHLDQVGYLADDILVKVDRASMGVSLEVRVPLLDPRVIAFAWRVPLDMKMRNGQGKRLLRQVLYRYVPEHLIERPKQGFSIPVDSWLRGPLRDWAEDLLDERRLREQGLFDPVPIRRRWREHVEGIRDRHYDLWDMLMFQAWWDHVKAADSERLDASYARVSIAAC